MYSNELYHHGVKGMKWGVRHDRQSNKSEILDKALSETVKQGKDKPNISPAEKIARNTMGTLNDTSRIIRSASKIKNRGKKSEAKYKKMSDDELRKRINRMDMERRYRDLVREEQYEGKVYADDYLDLFGGIASIAASTIGTIALIRSFKKG